MLIRGDWRGEGGGGEWMEACGAHYPGDDNVRGQEARRSGCLQTLCAENNMCWLLCVFGQNCTLQQQGAGFK